MYKRQTKNSESNNEKLESKLESSNAELKTQLESNNEELKNKLGRSEDSNTRLNSTRR